MGLHIKNGIPYGGGPTKASQLAITDTEGIIGTAGSTTNTQLLVDGIAGDIGTLSNSLADKQPKTLETPITVAGTQQTTVEGALGAINTEDAKAYKSDDTTETSIDNADYIPFYDSSASAAKKIAVSNLNLGGVETKAVSQYVETLNATAQGSYKLGECFLCDDGYYYRCKSAITGGSTTITTSNAEKTTVSEELGRHINMSTVERIIGTYYDGSTTKILYEKTVNCGSLPNNSNTQTDPQIANLDKVIHMFGMAYHTTANAQMPLPNVVGDSSSNMNYMIRLQMNNGKIYLQTYTDYTAYDAWVTIQYTKTA